MYEVGEKKMLIYKFEVTFKFKSIKLYIFDLHSSLCIFSHYKEKKVSFFK